MFLHREFEQPIQITNLYCDGEEYYAFWIIDFRCRECGKIFKDHPGTCDNCGSTDIVETEVDLYPIG